MVHRGVVPQQETLPLEPNQRGTVRARAHRPPMKILAWDLEMAIDEEAEEETELAGGAAAAGGGGV